MDIRGLADIIPQFVRPTFDRQIIGPLEDFYQTVVN